jgi:hypothetical protein
MHMLLLLFENILFAMNLQKLIGIGVQKIIRGNIEDNEDEHEYFLRMSQCKLV